MSNPAKYLPKFLGASPAIVLVVAALNFVVDPLQLFRPARLFAAMYSEDSRMQDAGLIRSQHFDTVFMGTSLAIHYRQSDIDRHLGVRSLKLAMPARPRRNRDSCWRRRWASSETACSGRWTTGSFATRRMSIPTSIFPPISTGATPGASPAIC